MQHLVGSVTPVQYIGRTVLKGQHCMEISMFLHLQFCNNGVKRYCTDVT
jgi:hypothetical protein